jgi:hypothetical protein
MAGKENLKFHIFKSFSFKKTRTQERKEKKEKKREPKTLFGVTG